MSTASIRSGGLRALGADGGVWGGELFSGGPPVPPPRGNGRPPKDAPARDARLRRQMTARIDEVLMLA